MRVPSPAISRRNFIRLGASGLVPLAGVRPTFAAGNRAPAKNVLVVLEQGGMWQTHVNITDLCDTVCLSAGYHRG